MPFRAPNTAAQGSAAQHIGRNALFGIIARLAQVSTRLVTIPIVIAHLGLAGYGIWSIIMTTAAYMRFGSVGVKSAFQKYVAEATGNGDFVATNKLLSTGCAAMLVLSLSVLIPIAAFSRALAKASKVPHEFVNSVAIAISILAVIMVLSNVGAVYEAIVMGGHRIDLARNFATFFTIAEAIAIVIFLHFGYGLVTMAAVMGTSELAFVVSCSVASKKVLPQVRVSRRLVTKSVMRELIRFAGSYQLVNFLEILYLSIIPITVLRAFGPEASGIYAITTRLVLSALMLADAFLLPILSAGAMIYASGSEEEMRKLITKSFKVTLGVCLFPLGFIAVFGPKMVFAWTGRVDSSFRTALWLVCTAGLFQAFSLLGLVLYRSSGRAFIDNMRQLLRIGILLSIVVFARSLDFSGVLAGLALAEFIGMIFMLAAVVKTFKAFRPQSLLRDAFKLGVSTAVILTVGLIATRIPSFAFPNVRLTALFELGKVFVACILAAWPALVLTKSLTRTEREALRDTFLRRLRTRDPNFADTPAA